MITSTAFTAHPVSRMGQASSFYEHGLGLHVRDTSRDVSRVSRSRTHGACLPGTHPTF